MSTLSRSGQIFALSHRPRLELRQQVVQLRLETREFPHTLTVKKRRGGRCEIGRLERLMGSQQVAVRVYDGARLVDGPLDRPVRILPNGFAGVVYAGEVYPLHPDDRIDLHDTTFQKHACSGFVTSGQGVPYAPVDSSARKPHSGGDPLLGEHDWYLEANRFGNYLVFDGDEHLAEQIVARLEGSRLGVRRWDASHRPANDGRHYDWFVRLGSEADRDTCLRELRPILIGTESSPAPTAPLEGLPEDLRRSVVDALTKSLAAVRETTTLKQQVSVLLDEKEDLTRRLQHLQLESAHVARDLQRRYEAQLEETEALRRDHAALVETHRQRLARLQATHDRRLRDLEQQLASNVAPAKAPSSSVDIDELVREGVSYLDQLEQAQEALSERGREVQLLRAEREALANSEARLKTDLREAEGRLREIVREADERQTVQRARGGRRRSLDVFFEKMLRRCELDEESMDELLKFDRIDKVIGLILRVDAKDPHLDNSIKDVNGYSGWREISGITTGGAGGRARGRLYFKEHAGGVTVVVHLKEDNKEQSRFLARRLRD